jgi:hypothetical protein
MKTSDTREIKVFLEEQREFSECIIEELALKNYGTTFEVVFNYIWNDSGELRANLDEPQGISLRFRLLQELRINNSLTSSMLRNPESINWGINEVALVKVMNDSNAFQTSEISQVPLIHVAFLWEGDRRIDVLFSEFEAVSDKTA